MEAIHLTRQSEIIDEVLLDREITVVGAGAIGSFTVLALAKMGFNNITVWDDDTIDEENMNCQFYRLKDIGTYKVDALRDIVKEFTGTEINTVGARFTGSSPLESSIVISAVDCMEARKLIFTDSQCDYLLDARMGAEYIMMFSVDANDFEQTESYRKTLYSNESAIQDRCTAKSTMYTVSLISGLLAKSVKDIAVGHKSTTNLTWNVLENSAIWFNGNVKGTM